MAGLTSMPGSTACAKVTDIDHVVIFIQENRSFDHYFGSYRGVRGFSDQSAAFQQPYPANTSNPPAGVLLPFHLDTTKSNAACSHDITHDWVPQHQSWNSGAMDGFVTSRLAINANDAVLAMGYYTRADLPYYYAVADAFTLCDNYFCSVIGPTDPNRLYSMAASIDPDGKNGGPLLQTLVTNRSSFFGTAHLHHHAGATAGARHLMEGLHVARSKRSERHLFRQRALLLQKLPGPLHRRSITTHSGPSFPPTFSRMRWPATCRRSPGSLASVVDSDHPPSPSLFGENTLSAIVAALTANPVAWAKTALFVTYDENGGFFDHVPPVTAPPGTPGEYVTVPAILIPPWRAARRSPAPSAWASACQCL